jgi:hypothetical protein
MITFACWEELSPVVPGPAYTHTAQWVCSTDTAHLPLELWRNDGFHCIPAIPTSGQRQQAYRLCGIEVTIPEVPGWILGTTRNV